MFKSIPREDFLGFLKYSGVLVGNSSSGMIEASYFGIPVINVGIRQKGRQRGKNVVDVKHSSNEIYKVIEKIMEKSTKRIARKYKTLEFLPIPLIFFLTMIFFTTIGGTVTFVFPLVLLFIASWLPPIVVRKNKRRRSKSSA